MRIRLATEDDAVGIVAIYAPIVTSTPISFETEPPSVGEIQRRVRETLLSHVWLICEDAGVVAGYAYATKHRVRTAYDWCVETSAYVGEEFRRRGVGRALYTSLFRILAAQGYVNAYAGITLPNAASVALHESVGFEPLGVYRKVGYKLGQWYDVGWWQLALCEYPAAPHPPRALRDAIDDARLHELLR
jgi:L-amino acid N-acyltransferase YncA